MNSCRSYLIKVEHKFTTSALTLKPLGGLERMPISQDMECHFRMRQVFNVSVSRFFIPISSNGLIGRFFFRVKFDRKDARWASLNLLSKLSLINILGKIISFNSSLLYPNFKTSTYLACRVSYCYHSENVSI